MLSIDGIVAVAIADLRMLVLAFCDVTGHEVTAGHPYAFHVLIRAEKG